MALKIQGIPTGECSRIWQGGADANGQQPLLQIAEGGKNPCRHCLGLIPEGDKILILAYRPFETLHPYAETGPIFLHAEPCARYDSDAVPRWFDYLDPAIVRGYGPNHWIRYDTGSVVRGKEITHACEAILDDPTIAYVHVRSKFNCLQCRIDRP